MKQHITLEQLDELTPAQREALREWWKANLSTYNVGCYKFGRSLAIRVIQDSESMHIALDDSFECLPLLSIGQCIEYLRDKDPELLCYTMRRLFTGICFYPAPVMLKINERGSKYYEPAELIDALWESVKAVLLADSEKAVKGERNEGYEGTE